jgi:hypothetical protein
MFTWGAPPVTATTARAVAAAAPAVAAAAPAVADLWRARDLDLSAGEAPALAWSTPARARRPSEAVPAEAGSPARLPEREAHAAPVALKAFVEAANALEAFVATEVQGAKDAVRRAVAERPAPPPAANLAPSDDVVRKLMSRMRTMMEEERFRSGKIR